MLFMPACLLIAPEAVYACLLIALEAVYPCPYVGPSTEILLTKDFKHFQNTSLMALQF